MGKARSFSNEANEIIYQTESNNENYSLGSQQNSYNLGSVHFSDQSGIGNFSQSGQNSKFVNLKGSTLQGNIGFVQQTVELDVGTFTINLNNDSTGTALAVISQDRIVTLSAGTTADLTTITGAQKQGQRVTLYNIFSNTITIKNDAGATVNTIVTPGAVDFSLSGHGLVTLVFDISLAQWRIEGNLGSGGGGTTLPVVDTTSIVKGSVDDTKLMRFEVDTLVPTTTTVVLTVPAADTTLAGLSISPQTFTGITTFEGSSFSVTSAVIILGDAVTDTINVGGRFGTDIIPILDADDDLGTTILRWDNIFGVNVIASTVTASLSLSSTGSTFLGDDIADTISFGGRVNTDIIPILDADDDLGTNVLRWDNIFGVSVIANTVTASVSFSSTGTTTLGDDAADNIFFGGQIATQMVFEEITVPGTPPANTITLYAKDDGGTSSLFFKDDAGAEFNLNAAGGAGANTALSNLASVAINTSLLPNADGTLNLGSAAFSWNDTFTERIRIETGGASTSTANQITADAGGMIFNTPAADRYEFNISGSPNGIAIEEDRIEFLTSGRQHRIDVTGTSINILAENLSDSIELWPGTGRTNEALLVEDAVNIWKNSTSGAAYRSMIQYSNATTTGQPAIGQWGFQAEDSANDQKAYTGIVSAIEDDTSSSRDGRMQIVVALNQSSGQAFVSDLSGIGLDIQGGASLKLGFFGVTPVARQSPAANSAAIITALENLGLFV